MLATPRTTASPVAAGTSADPAQLAKGALRRLARNHQAPTPDNFARAYAEEQGLPPPAATKPQAAAVAAPAAVDPAVAARPWLRLIRILLRGLDRSSRNWTQARRKDGLQQLLEEFGNDDMKLAQRLVQLVGLWEADPPGEATGALGALAGADLVSNHAAQAALDAKVGDVARPLSTGVAEGLTDKAAVPVIHALRLGLDAALHGGEPGAAALAEELAGLAQRIERHGIEPSTVNAVDAVCREARRLFGQRHQLIDELMALCRSLTDGLVDMAEDPAWVRGQTQTLRDRLNDQVGTRSVRAARESFDQTRNRQRQMQTQRGEAREALKSSLALMLVELGTLSQATGRFGDKVGNLAATVESADSLEGLANVVRELLVDSREVHGLVNAARDRLSTEHARAGELQSRVQALEVELRRLSDEATTDALTQIANRRGLAQAFAAEKARTEAAGADAPPLAVGLIDIDNFKRLNDSLGHAAGDEALKALAARVKAWLRPVDHVARFGGEEFVVMLPGMALEEAQQALSKLQRQLTASLFMHNGKEVFVTFSAGVTACRPGETVEAALERADEGLYEAKRTGKNRTCIVG